MSFGGSTATGILSLLALFAVNTACAATDPVTQSIAQIVAARDTVRGYVTDISKNYPPSSPQYQHAADLYRTAVGKYNGWSAIVADAIITGGTRKLNKDDTYKNISAQATQASQAFTDYVESIRGQTKGISLSVLGNLVDVGIRIWNAFTANAKAERTARADNFKSSTKWDQWEDIVSPKQTESKAKPTPAEESKASAPK